MNSNILQIKSAYENSGMTVDEIAQDMELEPIAVKASLMQCSSKYRKDCGKEPEDENELNFSDEQLKIVNRELFNLALGTEDEHVKAKLLMYIRDDKKGRRDAIKGLSNGNINILQFNQQILAAREKMKELVDV